MGEYFALDLCHKLPIVDEQHHILGLKQLRTNGLRPPSASDEDAEKTTQSVYRNLRQFCVTGLACE